MDAIECIKTRRSIRRFKSEMVREEDLRLMIDCARFAPSGTNMQNWHFIVIRNKEVMQRMRQVVEDKIQEIDKYSDAGKKVAQLARYFTFFANAPVVIVVLIEPRETFFEQLGANKYEAMKQSGYTAASGVAAAIENLLLAAHALGYGTCWMTGPLIAKSELEQILGVKKPFEIMALIPIGIPEKIPRAPERAGVEEITTWID
ncbi:MAG: nitroreductase family protein [Methanocellales archaeon]